MGNRCDKNVVRPNAVEDCVRKAIQDQSMLAAASKRVCQRRFKNAIDGMVDLERERLGCYFASLRTTHVLR